MNCASPARRSAGGSVKAGSTAIPRSASSGGRHRRTAPSFAENQIAALWRLDVALQEKTQWKMFYDGTPTLDVCPETGRARLSYHRAEEIFEENTRLVANPLASPDDIEDLDGWTLHRLRHSALTHDAEDGTSTPMLLARSRHTSVRSLERYARPGVDSAARHVAGRDPAARRRT
ncbi:hypothetical protein [Streptomyces sp. A 4/2]|uniref:hypothetical protein n=1 Tax=Streptomyces sp. A 4/2 TaxID=2934314 RepID=UPI002023E29A|nr:hypothetical protein [Streptomyces sp. A 4/2]